MPEPAALAGPWSWWRALSMAFLIGLRPCSGAILVLVFALSQGIFWAGILATFAMALGTALTVSVLAFIAVGARDLAKRFAGGSSRVARGIESVAGIGGAAAVVVFVVLFFLASREPRSPFG